MSKLFMMIGLPGSGKSMEAQEIARCLQNTVIHSSDAIRGELSGDESKQIDSRQVFQYMERRTYIDLQSGLNVIYDATNLKKTDRKSTLDIVRKIETKVEIIAIYMDADRRVCKQRNAERKRVVPSEVIDRMSDVFELPSFEEGFDQIITISAKEKTSNHTETRVVSNDRNDIEFVGVFFEHVSFYDKCNENFNDARLDNKVNHPHVTVMYRPDNIPRELFGQRVVFRAVGYANDKLNEGFLVEVQEAGAEIKKLINLIPVPHITISFSEYGRAVNTRYLKFESIEPIEFIGTFGGCTFDDEMIISRS